VHHDDLAIELLRRSRRFEATDRIGGRERVVLAR